MKAQENDILQNQNSPIKRLAVLSDFIFAAAMLLMVFQLDFPLKGEVNDYKELLNYYLGKDSDTGILSFLITFFLLVTYWFKHVERFSFYRKTNESHIFIETGFLAFVVLMPIANGLSGSFPEIIEIKVFYSLIMLVLGLLGHWGWVYASKQQELLSPNISLKEVRFIKHETLVEPFVALLSILMVYIYPILWDVSLLLIPVFFIIQKKWSQK